MILQFIDHKGKKAERKQRRKTIEFVYPSLKINIILLTVLGGILIKLLYDPRN